MRTWSSHTTRQVDDAATHRVKKCHESETNQAANAVRQQETAGQRRQIVMPCETLHVA